MSERFYRGSYDDEQAEHLGSAIDALIEHRPCEIRRDATFASGNLTVGLTGIHRALVIAGEPNIDNSRTTYDAYAPEGHNVAISLSDKGMPATVSGSRLDITVSESGTIGVLPRMRDETADLRGTESIRAAHRRSLGRPRPNEEIAYRVALLADTLAEQPVSVDMAGKGRLSPQSYIALSGLHAGILKHLYDGESGMADAELADRIYTQLGAAALLHGSPSCVVRSEKALAGTGMVYVSRDLFGNDTLGKDVTDDIEVALDGSQTRLLWYRDGIWGEKYYDGSVDRPATNGALAQVQFYL